MKRIDSNTRALIKEYHKYQGDNNVRIIRCVKGPRSTEAVLVRLNGQYGEDWSILDMVMKDGSGDPYVTELHSVPTKFEDDLIAWYKEEEDAAD